MNHAARALSFQSAFVPGRILSGGDVGRKKEIIMLEIGKMAPSFRLPAFPEGEITLEDLRGRPVLFYFYPKDNTSG